jgi:hypothetical protein
MVDVELPTGTRMVTVDVAIAHQGPRDVAGCRWSEWRVGVGSGLALTSIDDARCRPARAVGLRDTLLPILGTVALATARPRGDTVAITHATGRHAGSDGFSAQGGRGWTSDGCGVASWSRSARQSGRRCQSERKIKWRLGLQVRT